jgi:hypothetical protein
MIRNHKLAFSVLVAIALALGAWGVYAYATYKPVPAITGHFVGHFMPIDETS